MAVWPLSGCCSKNAGMFVFGTHLAVSVWFRRGGVYVQCARKSVRRCFLRPSRVAHVAHIPAAHL